MVCHDGPLREALADYLAVRRALGYRLARPEKLLGQFLDYLEDAGAATVTAAAALAWARLPASGDSNWWAYRLSAVRGFATYLHTIDPAHEVPARGPAAAAAAAGQPVPVFRRRHRRADRRGRARCAPRCGAATFADPDRAAGGHRHAGRRGDRLDRADVDLAAGRLTVRHGKFGKSRSWSAAPHHRRPRCAATCGCATGCAPATGTPALFVSTAGTRLLYCNVHATFQRLVRPAGLQPRSASCRPRIHDLRHSFAVRSLLDAYAAGQDGQATADAAVHLPRATSTRPAPTGTCPPRRSCSPWPGSGSKTTWRARP